MSMNPQLQEWRGKTVWLVGASSGIGRATASALHAAGATVLVSARNRQALESFVSEHPGAMALPLDVSDPGDIARTGQAILARGSLDGMLYCAGYYNEQRATAYNLAEMLKHEQINYTGVLYVLDTVLPHFLARRTGFISLVSSVAGFRGLPKSLAYGPTKAALINLAETLYQDLRDSGIAVHVINPGFVETGLTAQNEFEMPALITPQKAASEIMKGWAQGKFEIHFPKRFTNWMKLLRVLPYQVYFPAIRRATGL
jgi:short-subunit dehydrogenase